MRKVSDAHRCNVLRRRYTLGNGCRATRRAHAATAVDKTIWTKGVARGITRRRPMIIGIVALVVAAIGPKPTGSAQPALRLSIAENHFPGVCEGHMHREVTPSATP